MSEQDYPNNLNDFDDNFEIDTKESKLISWAHELEAKYNGAIRAVEHDDEAITRLVHALQLELNSEYPSDEFANQSVYVTGTVTQSVYNNATGEYSEETRDIKTEPLVVSGYAIEIHHTDEGRPVARACYRFDTRTPVIQSEIGSTRDTVTRQYAHAPIGSVEIHGHDYGLRKLDDIHFYHPEVVDELKSFVEVAGDEFALLKLLANQRVPADGSIDRQSLNVMQSYIVNKLNFDTEVPYIANLQGTVVIGDITTGGSVTIEYVPEKTTTVVTPLAVILTHRPQYTEDPSEAIRSGLPLSAETSKDLHWQLVVTRYPDDRSKDLQVLTLPLDSLKDIHPLRGIVGVPTEENNNI